MTESPDAKRLKRSISDDEAPFQFDFSKHLSAEDAALVTNFLSSHSDGHLCVSSEAEGATAYGALAALLGLLEKHTMLEIIDSKSSEFLELVKVVRGFSCEGKTSWLDSLEETVDGNSNVNVSSFKALDLEECTLDLQISSQRRWLNEWGKLWLFEADQEGFMSNIEILVDRLKIVRDKKKHVLDTRASLELKHTF